MKKISISSIKGEIKKAGASKGKFLYFSDGSKARVRFLTDMEDGLEITFHDSYQLGINVPCQETFGRECEYCDMDGLRTRKMYIWCVYDYDSKEVKLLMAGVNNCSPVPALLAMYETYGTLCDRDFEIKRFGKSTNTTYNVVPLDKSRFRNAKAKPFSEQSILKLIDKAYPADNSEIEEDEEEKPKKKTSKTKAKTKPKKKPEPEEDDEEDWDEEEDETEDYESMSARELFSECKDRGIDCKSKKSKEYYIDLLEQDDDESESDGWDEDDEEDWDE